MSAKIGLECVCSYNTGSYGSPVWVPLDLARDVKLGVSKGDGDVSRRGGGGFKMTRGTLIDMDVTVQMVKDTAHTNWTTFRGYFLNRSSVDMAFTDQAIANSGATGWRATMEVMKFEDSEPLDGAAMTDVQLRPCDTTHNPASYTT